MPKLWKRSCTLVCGYGAAWQKGVKGRGVRVVGRLRQERWEDKEGGKREKIIVVAEHVEFKPAEICDDVLEPLFDEEIAL